MRLTPELVKAARELLKIKQDALALEAGVAVDTLSKIERGESGGRGPTWDKIEDALTRLGVEFIADNAPSLGGGPGMRLRK